MIFISFSYVGVILSILRREIKAPVSDDVINKNFDSYKVRDVTE